MENDCKEGKHNLFTEWEKLLDKSYSGMNSNA